ncbi:molybdopterin molybdotransferase MoeA [Corynebacterium lizhenjunii]|uniref:Molybdopterin molybdenumtransferase n=1 Tax=Corynebacterium lizhenjunii TaxID=2709394 RepID=A0A7T0KH43_9CORY|nr:molybdopterin molybdotransferase MoeA [Corynebacterium lizhenjunii]QPK79990.1 molybdopterin molybdotransferase MoeA [Corynebacterium lizhenjunii]
MSHSSGQSGATSPEAYYQRVMQLCSQAAPTATAHIPVDVFACGRVLAADVRATWPVPPHANSAMDGFLVHRADLPAAGAGPRSLAVCGDVPAGSAPQLPAPGQAVRIMTGAPIPEFPAQLADTPDLLVVPVEDTDVPAGPGPLPSEVTIKRAPRRSNIRARGENLQPGDVLATSGSVVDPGTVAALLSAGVSTIAVRPNLRVAIISSGAELLPLHPGTPTPQTLPAGKIPDSNGPMLAALVRAAGYSQLSTHHSIDDPRALRGLFDKLSADHDVILTTGGISAGAFDVVRHVLSTSEQSWFGHCAQKPGAPQGHGLWKDTPVLCLPGNPVAAFVSFHLYLAPALALLSGAQAAPTLWARPQLSAQAASDFPAAPPGKLAVVPVSVDYSGARPQAVAYSSGGIGSHFVASLAGTTALAAYATAVSAGDPLDIYPF